MAADATTEGDTNASTAEDDNATAATRSIVAVDDDLIIIVVSVLLRGSEALFRASSPRHPRPALNIARCCATKKKDF